MKRLAFSKYLSAAFVAVALATLGSAPTVAQSLSHYGSSLPRYYEADGSQHWGTWAPQASEQKPALKLSPTLYMYVKPHRHHVHAN
jgi:hypothetical protein